MRFGQWRRRDSPHWGIISLIARTLAASGIVMPAVTPFELWLERELDVERQRFDNQWLFKWHGMTYPGWRNRRGGLSRRSYPLRRN